MWPFKKKQKPKLLEEIVVSSCGRTDCENFHKALLIRGTNGDEPRMVLRFFKKYEDDDFFIASTRHTRCCMCVHFEHTDLFRSERIE